MNLKTNNLVICLLFFFIAGMSYAGKEVRSKRLSTAGIQAPSATLVVNDDKFTNTSGWNTGFYDLPNTVKAEFGIDEDQHIFHGAYFYAEVVFDIQFINASLSTSSTLTKTLQIDYRPGGGIYKDKDQVLFTGYYRASISNMTVTAWDSPAKSNTVTVPADLYLDLEIATDRVYDFDLGVDKIAYADYGKRFFSTSNELEIYWDFFKGAEEYELEWTFVDNYNGTGGYITSGTLLYDFKHDATRVITPNNFYKIPMTYEHGYLMYRIRPIGRNSSYERLDGAWTLSKTNGNVFSGTDTLNYFYFSTPFNSDTINWTSTKTFAEMGKLGVGVAYLDALSFNRQSVAKLNSESKSIVQSTLYDHFGRPAINFLPVPVSGLKLNYTANLNKVVGGSIFDKRVFDLCSNNNCDDGTSIVLDTVNSTGAAKYYSGSNANKENQNAFIPTAIGRPYTQTKYKKDLMGRVSEQTLPGSMHTLSSGKSILYDYSKPSQIEIDRLFGSEGGSALHYEKHFVKDPNGQTSVSYVDMYDRTVATALLGDAPASLDTLSNYIAAVTLKDELISVNQLANDCYEVNSSFYVTYPSEQQTFTYTTNIVSFVTQCSANLCLDCQYDLYISITDECGNEVFFDHDGDGGASTPPIAFHDTIGASEPYESNCLPLIAEQSEIDAWNNAHKFKLTSASSSTNIVVTFPHPGVYNVHKKICVSDKPLDTYLNIFLDDNTCHKSLCDFIDSLTTGTSFKTCSLSCSSCSENLDSEGTNTVQAQEDCENLLCGVGNHCKAIKQLLMADFMPGGLYGATTSTNSTAWAHSIYNATNTAFPNIPNSYSWAHPPLTIKDANGNAATVNYLGSSISPTLLPNYSAFVSNWQNSWAEAFLPLHPEYCKMQFYCNVVGASFDFDVEMQKVDFYDDACSTGFIFPYEPLGSGNFSAYPPNYSCDTTSRDPMFSVTTGTLYTLLSSGIHSNFDATMLDYISGSPTENIYQTASQMSISNPLPTGYTFGSNVCFQDLEWRKLKELYLKAKKDIYMALYAAYLNNGSYCTPLSQISNSDFLTNHIPIDSTKNAMVGALGYTLSGTSGPADSTSAATAFQTNCDTTCNAYAALWAQNIAACPNYTLNSTDSTNMIRDLIAVCKKGCDYSNPWGASNYPTGGSPAAYIIPSTTDTVYSFQDVLDHYFLPGSNPFGCDANLIMMPAPHNASGLGSNSSAFLTDCGCDKILQVDYDYTNTINVPSGITSARKLFNYRYNKNYKDYNFLLCACKSALTGSWTPNYSWSSTEITNITNDSIYADPTLKCDACITCTQLESVISAMDSDYNFTASSTDSVIKFINNNQQVALNNFNKTFNLNNTLQDYLLLFIDCRQFNATGTQYTFSNTLNPEAAALQLYLDDLASKKLLTSDHNMSLCLDEKYYMSDLYRDSIPNVSNTYYDANVSGNILTIDIKSSPSATTALCSLTLTLPGSPPSWSNVSNFASINAYAPTPSAGPVFGFQITVSDGVNSALATGVSSCWSMATLSSTSPYGPQLCPRDTNYMPNACQKKIMSGIIGQAKTLYQQYIDSLSAAFKKSYMDTCIAGLNESFTREYDLKEYHYTLYYYDQAGNLTRSVAPAGVTPLSITTPIGSGTPQYPLHSSATLGVSKYYNNLYQFNSYNEPMLENSVDGGQTIYFYDLTGRIVASQNAKQVSNYTYSYTFYDVMGRIKEVGEVTNSSDSSGVLSMYMAEDSAKVSSFVRNGTRSQVIRSYYDETASGSSFSNASAKFTAGAQVNLRNRITAVTYEEVLDATDNTYDFGTHYTYDEHGNVIELVHENPSLDHLLNQRHKLIEYEYELISGNVSKVIYQKNQLDQFMHKYEYDADNRLASVYTSHDGTNWDKDAKYLYYEHGPMARVEIGDKQVQAEDYFYTIHGWIKGMNSNQIATYTDPGKDGASTTAYNSILTGFHQYIGKDAAAYTLNYYNQGTQKDYVPIKAHNTSTDGDPLMSTANIRGSSNINLNTDAPDLYNGNISSMVTTIKNMDINILDESSTNTLGMKTPFPQIAAYKYDQLHRIKKMKTFREYSASSNEWNSPSASTYTTSYYNTFTYDLNGNILSQFRTGADPLLRSGSTLNMDDLTYTYYNLPALKTNKLICVGDNSGYTSNYNNDVDDQSGNCSANPGGGWYNTNYSYDDIGNLTSDSTECIMSIQWTVDRKVKKVTRSEKQLTTQGKTLPDIEYLYDANRQRVAKIVKPRDASTKGLLDQGNWIYTYYTYDASGNVMATYNRTYSVTAGGWTDMYDLKEYDIYGNKRLGLIKDDAPVLATRDFSANINHHEFVDIEYDTPPSGEDIFWDTPERWLGKKQYEISNHLGNVITVVSDRKIPAALSNSVCVEIFDMESGVPATIYPQYINLAATGGELVATMQTGYSISGMDCKFGMNITPTSYLIEFDFDPGDITTGDGLYIIPFDLDFDYWNFYMGSYFCDGSYVPAAGHYSYTYTPSYTGTNTATYLAFNTNGSTNHHFKIDNLTMCPIGDIPVVQNYDAEVLETHDYYPFGMDMPGRKYVAGDAYRTGLNGQEHDDEIFEGAYGAEYWEYDGRLGRRWNIDPVINENEGPYTVFNNSPIAVNDPDGSWPKWLQKIFAGKKGSSGRYKHFLRRGHGGKGRKGRKGGNTGHSPSIGQLFMKLGGYLRAGARHNLMLIPQGKYEYDKTVVPVGNGVLSNGQFSIINLYNSKNSPWDRLASVELGTSNNDFPFLPSFGYMRILGSSGHGFKSLNTNTGLQGFGFPILGEDINGDGVWDRFRTESHGRLIPGMQFLIDYEVGNYSLAGGRLPGFGFPMDFLTSIALLERGILQPWHRKKSVLKVENVGSVFDMNYNVNVRYFRWRRVLFGDRGKLWQKLHSTKK